MSSGEIVTIELPAIKMRSAKYDNMKALLIFCVVFGHCLMQYEVFDFFGLFLYIFIYSFHMPAFIYLVGKFSKPSWNRIWQYAGLYLACQVIFFLFLKFVCGADVGFSLINPQYTLWFLLATIAYTLIAFVMPQSFGLRGKILFFGASVLVSVLTGFLPFVGETLALAQFFAFLPFFVAGRFGYPARSQNPIHAILCFIGAVLLLLAYIVLGDGSLGTLYMRECYAESNSTWYLRLLVLIVAFLLIRFLVTIIPEKKVPILTDMGKHTLFIFLGHSFVIKYIASVWRPAYPLLFSLGFSVCLTLALWGAAVLWGKIKKCIMT